MTIPVALMVYVPVSISMCCRASGERKGPPQPVSVPNGSIGRILVPMWDPHAFPRAASWFASSSLPLGATSIR